MPLVPSSTSNSPVLQPLGLAGFNPRKGDLVLLVEENTEFPIPPLLAYVGEKSRSGVPIHVIDPLTYLLLHTFYAERAAFFDVNTTFGQGDLPFPKEVTTETRYRASKAIVGKRKIVEVLRTIPGLELYAYVVNRGFPNS